jgi:hypothetical protein
LGAPGRRSIRASARWRNIVTGTDLGKNRPVNDRPDPWKTRTLPPSSGGLVADDRAEWQGKCLPDPTNPAVTTPPTGGASVLLP